MEDEAELVALRRRVRELEALESVARAARAPIELDDALAALVESAATSLHAEVCALEVASARGARGEIAFRSSLDGPTDEELGGLAALAPHVEAGRLAIPLPTRRGAHGALVAWRSRPGGWSAREQELAEAKAQLKSKQSSLESARRGLDRNKANITLQDALLKRREELSTGHWISDRVLDEVRANAEIAKADFGVAEANSALAAAQVDLAAATVEKIKTLLSYRQIVAPFDGVVARRLVNRGDLVQAATATRTTPSAGSLFTVQRIDTIRVFCDVPENDVPQLHIGDPAIVKPYGFDGKSFIGKVTRFSSRLNPETRNMRTEIDLLNPEERLYPGMYAEVSLE